MSKDATRRNTSFKEGSTHELLARMQHMEATVKTLQEALTTVQGMYQGLAARLALVEHRTLVMDYAPIPTASSLATDAATGVSNAVAAVPSLTAATATGSTASTKAPRETNSTNRQLEEELQRLGLTPASSGFAAAAQNDPASLAFEHQAASAAAQSQPSVASTNLSPKRAQQPPSVPTTQTLTGFIPAMMSAHTPSGTSPSAMMPVDGAFTGSPMTAQPPAMFPRVAVNPAGGAMPNPLFADPYFMAAYAQQQQQPQPSPSSIPLSNFNMMVSGGMPHMVAAPMGSHGPNTNNNNNNSNSPGSGGPAASVVVIDPSRASNEMLDRVCQQSQHQYVKDLCLKGCKAITNFTPLSRLRNLWKLNLQGCAQSVDDNVVKLIGTSNTRISRLNLCGCERVTDATPLAQLAYLFDLNLSGCQIGNASLLAISNGCGQLSRLAINSCPLVTSIACCGNLKELKLLYCRYSANISPASISEVLSTIGHNLLTLNVDGVKFDALELRQLPPNGTALKNFNLKDNSDLTDLSWLTSAPEASRMFAALETLDMEGCAHLIHLGDLAQLPGLKTLRLSGTGVSLDELRRLAQNPAVRLHTLYVDGCAALTDLSCLSAMRTLTKLIIDSATQGASARELPAVVNGQVELVVAQPSHAGSGSPTSAHGPSGRSPTTHGPSMGAANTGGGSVSGGFIGGCGPHHGNTNNTGGGGGGGGGNNNLAVGSGYFVGNGSHGHLTPGSVSPFTSPTVFTVPPMPTIDQPTNH